MAELTIAEAQELHRRAAEAAQLAGQLRVQRDDLIRHLHYRGDRMTYAQLAAAIGCSPDLIKSICLGRVGPGTRGRRQAG